MVSVWGCPNWYSNRSSSGRQVRGIQLARPCRVMAVNHRSSAPGSPRPRQPRCASGRTSAHLWPSSACRVVYPPPWPGHSRCPVPGRRAADPGRRTTSTLGGPTDRFDRSPSAGTGAPRPAVAATPCSSGGPPPGPATAGPQASAGSQPARSPSWRVTSARTASSVIRSASVPGSAVGTISRHTSDPGSGKAPNTVSASSHE